MGASNSKFCADVKCPQTHATIGRLLPLTLVVKISKHMTSFPAHLLAAQSHRNIGALEHRPTRRDPLDDEAFPSTSLPFAHHHCKSKDMLARLHRDSKRSSKETPSFRSRLSKIVSSKPQTPRTVANEIRRLRRHELTAVTERHDSSNVFYRGTEENQPVLMSLCSQLFEFYDISHSVTPRNEILALCSNDPGIYLLFRKLSGTSFLHLRNTGIVGHEEFHSSWSKLIGRRDFENEVSDFPNIKEVEALKEGQREVIVSLMLTYLLVALPLDFRRQSKGLNYVLETWFKLVDCIQFLKGTPADLLSKIELIVKLILDTGKPIKDFLPPKCITKLTKYCIQDLGMIPTLITTMFFAIPDVQLHRHRGHISGASFSYHAIRGWNIGDASSYAVSLSSEMRRGSGYEMPKETVLCETSWMTLYRASEFVLSIYLRQKGFTPNGYEGRHFIPLVAASLSHLKLDNARFVEELALAPLFVAQFFDIDRYCRRAILTKYSDDTESIMLLNSHSRFTNQTVAVNGLYDQTFMPQFENVPYLRRFKIDGNYFITTDDLPDKFLYHFILDYSVDTMLLDGYTLVCLVIHGKKTNFDSTGHYPILAGHNASGSPLYVAAVRAEQRWYFGTVEEGAREVEYYDELGKRHLLNTFFVLALRHNPSDLPPPYPRLRRGAMDPTGPVFWMRFRPERDPEYYDDPRSADDVLLESFLDEIRDRSERERYLLSGFD